MVRIKHEVIVYDESQPSVFTGLREMINLHYIVRKRVEGLPDVCIVDNYDA